jgi:hypothetical protein
MALSPDERQRIDEAEQTRQEAQQQVRAREPVHQPVIDEGPLTLADR